MNWTTETPTQEGYYWFRHKYSPGILTIIKLKINSYNSSLMVYTLGFDYPEPLINHSGYFYGPLTPPEFSV